MCKAPKGGLLSPLGAGVVRYMISCEERTHTRTCGGSLQQINLRDKQPTPSMGLLNLTDDTAPLEESRGKGSDL